MDAPRSLFQLLLDDAAAAAPAEPPANAPTDEATNLTDAAPTAAAADTPDEAGSDSPAAAVDPADIAAVTEPVATPFRVTGRLSTRVLDTGRGAPAMNVPVIFDAIGDDGTPTPLGRVLTDADGRAAPDETVPLDFGYYRLTFDVAGYFGPLGVVSCYPVISIVVQVVNPHRDFHVPLLLGAGGYSTHHG